MAQKEVVQGARSAASWRPPSPRDLPSATILQAFLGPKSCPHIPRTPLTVTAEETAGCHLRRRLTAGFSRFGCFEIEGASALTVLPRLLTDPEKYTSFSRIHSQYLIRESQAAAVTSHEFHLRHWPIALTTQPDDTHLGHGLVVDNEADAKAMSSRPTFRVEALPELCCWSSRSV